MSTGSPLKCVDDKICEKFKAQINSPDTAMNSSVLKPSETSGEYLARKFFDAVKRDLTRQNATWTFPGDQQ